nr:kinesin-like protein KIN-14J [Ipomoea trifida]
MQQHNSYKSREEKYQLKDRAYEALRTGAAEEHENVYYSASKETGRMLPLQERLYEGYKKHVQSCLEVQDKANSSSPKLMNLVLGIFGENAEPNGRRSTATSTAATLLRILNGKEEPVHFHRCIRPTISLLPSSPLYSPEPRRREGARGSVEAAGLHPVLPLPLPLPIVKASPEIVVDLPSLCRLIEEKKHERHRGVHLPPSLGHVGRAGRTPSPLAAHAGNRGGLSPLLSLESKAAAADHGSPLLLLHRQSPPTSINQLAATTPPSPPEAPH